MTKETFTEFLKSLNACEEAQSWASGLTLKAAWGTCPRADWLLWVCGKMADKPGWPTRKEVVLAACACAETALKYVREGEDRPRKCIEVARQWAAGKASIEAVRKARAATYAATAYAATAAYAAAYAATADAAYAAAYAAATADAAAYAAAYADAAYSQTRAKTLAELADLVRLHLKPEATK